MLAMWKWVRFDNKEEKMTLDDGGKKMQTSINYSPRTPTVATPAKRSNVTLVKLLLENLIDNPVQPPNRTTGADMEDLIADIREKGIVNPPYVALLGSEYYKLDGHRRCAAWEKLGHRDVMCRVIRVSSMSEIETHFVTINRVVKKMSGRQWFYGWAVSAARAAYLKALTKGQARRIAEFVKVFGVDESVGYAKTGLDPCILNYVYVANRFLSFHLPAPSMKHIGRWIVANKATWTVRHLAANGKKREAQRLDTCIRTGKPYLVRAPRVRASKVST